MYHSASAAYAATAKLALTGVELQAEALFAAARRLRALLAQWPETDAEIEGALDHAARVWSLVLGDVLDDPGMPDEGLETAERLAGTVFAALREALDTPTTESIAGLYRLTSRYATSLRQAAQPTPRPEATSPFLQRLRRRISTGRSNESSPQLMDESNSPQRRARA